LYHDIHNWVNENSRWLYLRLFYLQCFLYIEIDVFLNNYIIVIHAISFIFTDTAWHSRWGLKQH
jgi:hypothetical protein